jgi:hypothetical protein
MYLGAKKRLITGIKIMFKVRNHKTMIVKYLQKVFIVDLSIRDDYLSGGVIRMPAFLSACCLSVKYFHYGIRQSFIQG